VADAGPDQEINYIGQVVQLNGGTSYDMDGDTITYIWSFYYKPEGSLASLSNPTAVNPTFVADLHGKYDIRLMVNDPWEGSSVDDKVTLSFNNVMPVANAGTNQSVAAGATVTLDGSASSDANLDPLAYRWSFASVPPGSSAVLSDPAAVRPAFVADLVGTYVASLVVNDGFGDSAASNVTVTATSNTADVTTVLKRAIEAINLLGPNDFKNPNMRNALTNKINAVLNDIQAGLYTDALSKLQHDILMKTDGCATGATPDKNDWITACSKQSDVYRLLQQAIDLLWTM
jgi:hypothetical protein